MKDLPSFGYWAATADIIHQGHVRAIKFCASKCRNLIVGLMTDECVAKYKKIHPVIAYEQRKEVIESIKGVAWVIPQETFEYGHAIMRIKEFWEDDFIIFDSPEHRRNGHDIVVPRTDGISSSRIKQIILERSILRI